MKLKELHVEGFGHFRDHVVGPLNSSVTVLHGPNEAGKSTLLAFIRTILFGFPSRGRDDYYRHSPEDATADALPWSTTMARAMRWSALPVPEAVVQCFAPNPERPRRWNN